MFSSDGPLGVAGWDRVPDSASVYRAGKELPDRGQVFRRCELEGQTVGGARESGSQIRSEWIGGVKSGTADMVARATTRGGGVSHAGTH